MRQMTSNLTAVGKPGRIITQRVLDGIVFPHTCDLWKPAPLSVNANKSAKDGSFVIAVAGQKCRYIGTTEVDKPEVEGRTKQINIFTLDHWMFPIDVAIKDTWWMKLTSAHSQQGQFWAVQGNPQSQEANPFHLVHCLLVYGKQGPPPTGVS